MGSGLKGIALIFYFVFNKNFMNIKPVFVDILYRPAKDQIAFSIIFDRICKIMIDLFFPTKIFFA